MLSTDDFCTKLLTDALEQVTALCNREAFGDFFASLDS
jgi:hypothetical protein